MEIQLTKTKKITIGGAGGSAKKREFFDLVGIDLFSGDARGCPAVRLVEKNGALQLVAAGFVPPPDLPLPASWEEASKKCAWALPTTFQAPSAAIAVTSPDMFLAQTTLEAFKADLASGNHKKDDPSAAGKRKLGVIRNNEPKTAATLSARLAGPAKTATAATKSAPPPVVKPGVPLSHAGTRFVMQPMTTSDGFVMEAGMPEFQVLWLSRLLPEGKRPTAASIQLRPSALAASVLRQPTFKEEKGSTLALFVGDDEVHVAGYKGGDLVLWRTCRGVPGWRDIREQIKQGLGLEDDMVESVLDDKLIDPRPVLEPAIAPILTELAISRDYLVGKLGLEPRQALLMGIRSGADYWRSAARERARVDLVAPTAFEGIVIPDKARVDQGIDIKGTGSYAFLGAIGAAVALFEEDAQ